jgi:hypothetical protein
MGRGERTAYIGPIEPGVVFLQRGERALRFGWI